MKKKKIMLQGEECAPGVLALRRNRGRYRRIHNYVRETSEAYSYNEGGMEGRCYPSARLISQKKIRKDEKYNSLSWIMKANKKKPEGQGTREKWALAG